MWFTNSGGGYGNALSFKKIDDTDIAYIEEKVRSNGCAIRKQLDESVDMDCEPSDHSLIDIFGKVYASDPSNFHFERGELLLIKELVAHVKGIVDANGIPNSGLKRFQYKTKIKKSKKSKCPQAEINPETKEHFSKMENNDRISHLKADLLRLVSACMEKHVEHLDEGTVDVHVKSNGRVYGTILCVICEEQKKKNRKPHRVYYSETNSRSYWVLANYQKHLKLHTTESIQSICSERRNHIKVEPASANMPDESTSLMDEETPTSPKADSSELYLVDESGQLTLVEMIASAAEAPSNLTNDDNENWLFDQFSSQIVQMAEATLANSDAQETMMITLENKSFYLTVATIPGDGFCLFGALAHQLFRNPINSPQHKKATKKLKSEVVKYILAPENFPNFEFILKNRVYDMKKSNEITDMSMECKLFVRYSLDKTGWGGAETLQAISEIYKSNILIFNEDETCYIYKNNHKYEQTVAIAYRLNFDEDGNVRRNHYDSVCDMDANDMYTATFYAKNRMK